MFTPSQSSDPFLFVSLLLSVCLVVVVFVVCFCLFGCCCFCCFLFVFLFVFCVCFRAAINRVHYGLDGAGSDVSSDRSLMLDPLSYFLFQSLLLKEKSNPCSGGSEFPLSLSGPLPYV